MEATVHFGTVLLAAILLEVSALLPKLDQPRFSDSLHVGLEKTED
jgi:hypothetical protein